MNLFWKLLIASVAATAEVAILAEQAHQHQQALQPIGRSFPYGIVGGHRNIGDGANF